MDFIANLEKEFDTNKKYGFEETIAPNNGEITASQNILPYWTHQINKWIKENTNTNYEQLILLKNMQKYPNNSNLENYILINNILTDQDIDEIFNEIIQQPEFNNNQKNKNDLLNIIGPNNTFYKRKRRLLSLMLLNSRNIKNSFFSKNPEKILYKNITNYFFNINTFLINSNPKNDPEIYRIPIANYTDTSYYIKNIFINFIKIQKLVNMNYIKDLVYGNALYNIYKNKYQNSDNIEIIGDINSNTNTEIKSIFSIKDYKTIIKKNLTKEDIVKRIFEWLNINDNGTIDPKLNKFAVSYIFSIYSPGDINSITNIDNICKEISELKDELNQDIIVPNSQSFKSIFSTTNQETFQENLGNKINKLIKTGGNNVTKKRRHIQL